MTPQPMAGQPGRPRLAGLGLLLAAGLVGAGCGGARNSLGTSVTPCFRALPPAKSVVHGKGRLVGVRRVDVDKLRQRIPNDTKLAGLPNQQLCVFAFQGPYHTGEVDGVVSDRSGQYAVVAVTSKHGDVVGAFVLDQLPTRFRHLH